MVKPLLYYGYGTADELVQAQPIAQISEFSQLISKVDELNVERKFHNH